MLLIDREFMPGRERSQASADRLLPLAAAAVLAAMALFTGIHDGGMPAMPCPAGDASPLTGMVPVYLLMSVFHLAPWPKLLFR